MNNHMTQENQSNLACCALILGMTLAIVFAVIATIAVIYLNR